MPVGNYFLPMVRGTTWKDGNTASTAGANNGLPGNVYASHTKNRNAVGSHAGISMDEELIVLRNRCAASIGGGSSGREVRRLYKMAKAASAIGNIVSNCIWGEKGYPLDDCYATVQRVAVGDDAYFVRRGLARLTLITATSGGSPNSTQLIARTGGLVGPVTAAGTYKETVALALETFTATAGQRTILCLLGSEFTCPDNS